MSGKIPSRAGVWTGFAAALGLALVAAQPARAGEFSHGFENELGRIAAHAAVGAGFHLLHHVPAPHYVEHRVVEVHRPHYRPHPRHYRHPGRGHGRGHYKHRYHDHGYGPCGADHRVTYERHEHYTRTRY